MSISKNAWIAIAIVLVLGAGAGYKAGFSKGYEKAVADTKSAQEEVAKKSAEQAAAAANPFKATNPLEGVTANPFDDAAKKLNPFAD